MFSKNRDRLLGSPRRRSPRPCRARCGDGDNRASFAGRAVHHRRGDKTFDTADFVADMRAFNLTPHIAQKRDPPPLLSRNQSRPPLSPLAACGPPSPPSASTPHRLPPSVHCKEHYTQASQLFPLLRHRRPHHPPFGVRDQPAKAQAGRNRSAGTRPSAGWPGALFLSQMSSGLARDGKLGDPVARHGTLAKGGMLFAQ